MHKKAFLIPVALLVGIAQIIAVWTMLITVSGKLFGIEYSLFDVEKAQKYFYRDQEDILLLTEYFVRSGYEDVSISDSSGTMFTGLETMDVPITEEALNAVKRLRHKGYGTITRHGNTISFVMQTAFTDGGKGVAYSIDGEYEPTLPYLTKPEPLEEDGWYYYEENYNEYRNRNS